jgi:signal transduction histidine kinase
MKLKQLRSNLALKILAIFLAGIMAVLMFFSVADAFFVTLLVEKCGTYEMARQEVAKVFLDNLSYNLGSSYSEYGVNIDSMYENANFYYQIFSEEGELLHTNYSGEDFWFYYNSYSAHGYDRYNVSLYVKNEISNNDNMALALSLFDFALSWRNISVAITLVSALFLIVLLTFLFCSAGHKSGIEGITLNVIDKIPFEIYLSFYAFVGILEIWFLDFFTYDIITVAFVCVFGFVDFMLLIGLALSIATRIKSRTIFKNTVIYFVLYILFKIFKKVFKTIKYIFTSIPFIYKTIIITSLVFIIDILSFFNWNFGILSWIIFQFIEKIVVFVVIILMSAQFKDIKNAIKKISKGEVEYKINTSNLYLDFEECANDLNNIGAGLSAAVEEKTKSERFKAELITNVSHDIKTPLTSIINYVDLIKKEPCQSEKITEHINVLDRQSHRLKKLTDDLIEASKASSGSLSVNLKPLDLNVLLIQAAGEYEEKMSDCLLELVINYPETPTIVLADGQHLWRVFDNLLNNITKYAQPNTRVYISIEKK